MRTWGRVFPAILTASSAIGSFVIGQSPIERAAQQPPYWQEVTTDAQGNNDQVWLTTLLQCLQLNLGESPMFGNYGIPAQQSVVTQVFPDYYVMQTQQQFAPYFASLIIRRLPGATPMYDINVVTHAGVEISTQIPVPQ